MLIQLDKATTKELEYATTPVMNVMHGYVRSHIKEPDLIIRGVYAPIAISSWYMTWELDPNRFTDQKNKLIEVLELKPNYHVNYEYRNAVWGLDIEGQLCILYTSIKGTSLQVEEKTTVKRDLRAVFEPLVIRMINWDFLDSGSEKAEFAKKWLSLKDYWS